MIGVLGGYGGVGLPTVRQLDAWGVGPMRIGGRRPALARQVVDHELGGRGEVAAVDIDDPASLRSFCEGCDIVVNCAGPSHQILDVVARAALAVGADYVDAAGDDPVHQLLQGPRQARPGWIAILSAGMLPGISGLMPRYLAGLGFDRVLRLTAYAGGLDHFTPAGASDYVRSLFGGFGEPLASWSGGVRVSRSLIPLVDLDLPFFPGRVTAHPFLATETERVAAALGLDDVRWYNVFDGTHVIAALGRLQGALTSASNLEAAAVELVQASKLDMFGRTPYWLFVTHLDGESDGRPHRKTMVVGARGANELTGLGTALTVAAIHAGDVEPGLWYADEVLNPARAVDRLRTAPAVTAIEVLDDGIDAAELYEEAAL